MKKKCRDCEENKTIRTSEDAQSVQQMKRKEPDIAKLIRRYGIIGVMRMCRVHFEELIQQEDADDAHRTVFVLLSNYERILREKLEVKAPEQVQQTKQSLRELGVKY